MDFSEIYSKLTDFEWEPRFETTDSYLVRRKGKLVKVCRSEVRGKWTAMDGYETYNGEDYGRVLRRMKGN